MTRLLEFTRVFIPSYLSRSSLHNWECDTTRSITPRCECGGTRVGKGLYHHLPLSALHLLFPVTPSSSTSVYLLSSILTDSVSSSSCSSTFVLHAPPSPPLPLLQQLFPAFFFSRQAVDLLSALHLNVPFSTWAPVASLQALSMHSVSNWAFCQRSSTLLRVSGSLIHVS